MDFAPYEYRHSYSESFITAADHTRPTPFCLYEAKDGVAYVTLDNPEKLNALGDDLMDDLFSCLKRALLDPAVEVVVLAGNGRAFSSGLNLSVGTDVGEIGSPINPDRAPSVSQYWGFERRRCVVWDDVARFPKPTIARVHGYCLGAAFLLARACDAIVADRAAKLGVRGFHEFPTGLYEGGFWPVDSQIFRCNSYDNEAVNAEEWQRAGLVSDCVPGEQLDERVAELVAKLRSTGLAAAMRAKQEVRQLELSGGLRRAFRAHQGGHVAIQWVRWRGGETNFYREKREGGFQAFLSRRRADTFAFEQETAAGEQR